MQHVRVALYKAKPGTVDDVIRKAQGGMLPIFRAQPGFIGYGLVKTGDDALIEISAWQTSAHSRRQRRPMLPTRQRHSGSVRTWLTLSSRFRVTSATSTFSPPPARSAASAHARRGG